jgi:hypothetical protein
LSARARACWGTGAGSIPDSGLPDFRHASERGCVVDATGTYTGDKELRTCDKGDVSKATATGRRDSDTRKAPGRGTVIDTSGSRSDTPFVFGPEFAMANIPAPTNRRSGWISSANLSPKIDVPPLPVPVGSPPCIMNPCESISPRDCQSRYQAELARGAEALRRLSNVPV